MSTVPSGPPSAGFLDAAEQVRWGLRAVSACKLQAPWLSGQVTDDI